MARLILIVAATLMLSGCVEYRDISAPEWEEPVYVEGQQLSDDHSRIARLEEGIKAVCHTLDEIKEAASRREQKMDSIADAYIQFKEHRESVCRPLHARLDDLELRVRALESFKWKALGAIGVVSFMANVLASKL